MAKTKKTFPQRISNAFLPLIKGNNAAKLFFLLLSVFLWFLINLSKEGYVTRLNYPVSYSQIPDGMRLTNQPPRVLEVGLRGKGFEILKLKLKSLDPVQLSLQDIDLGGASEYEFETIDQAGRISEELGENIEVLSIEPKMVNLQFSPIEKRKFKVYLRSKNNFSKFKTFYEAPVLSPDSIAIWGTNSELDLIDSIFTEELVLTADEDSIIKNVSLDLPTTEGLEFSHKTVQLSIRYTSLTEGTIELPISIRHDPNEYNVTLIPKKVNLTYRIPVEDFSKVSAEDFDAYVDYREAGDDTEFLTIKVKSNSRHVREMRFEPRQVEYILSK